MFVGVDRGIFASRRIVHVITNLVIIVSPGVHQAGGCRAVRQAVGFEDDDLLGPLASHAAGHAGREGDGGRRGEGPQSAIRGRGDGELVVAQHECHGEAGISVGTRRVREVGRGDRPGGGVGGVGSDLGIIRGTVGIDGARRGTRGRTSRSCSLSPAGIARNSSARGVGRRATRPAIRNDGDPVVGVVRSASC